MRVIGITVKIESVLANDLTKGEHVGGEEDRTEDRALRDALVDWSRWRVRAV